MDHINTDHVLIEPDDRFLVLIHENGFMPFAITAVPTQHEAESTLAMMTTLAKRQSSKATFSVAPIRNRLN